MAPFGLSHIFSHNSVFLSQQFSQNSVFQPVSAKIQQAEWSHKGKSMSWANLEHLQQSDFSNLQLEKIVILKIL